MQVVYAKEPFPSEVVSSIFLAGPTPRDKNVLSWRPQALAFLEMKGFQGHVFVPEDRSGTYAHSYQDQVDWEEEGLHRADCILFWIPRDMVTMPGLTTNDEWGVWKDSGKVVLGTLHDPARARHTRYQEYYAHKLGVPHFKNLPETVDAALAMVGQGAIRRGGECTVPLFIWDNDSFQKWYRAQIAAGNRFDGARVCWTLRVGLYRSLTAIWVVHANVFVTAEGRSKSNEVVVGRQDISTMVLWQRAATLEDTRVVIVREFRTPTRTADGFVRELPGGSSKEGKAPIETAVRELEEETGFSIDMTRLRAFPPRQMAGTISSFQASMFSAEIGEGDMQKVLANVGAMRGLAAEGEQTYLEVWRVGDLLAQPTTDWATLGMIFTALSSAMR